MDEKRQLSRGDILERDDILVEDVYVKEWGGTVRVRTLTARERDLWEDSRTTRKGADVTVDMTDFRASLVVRSVVDGDGERLFEDDDLEAIGAKSGAAIDKLWDVAARLSGISKEDEEELSGNVVASETTLGGSSPSDSPES